MAELHSSVHTTAWLTQVDAGCEQEESAEGELVLATDLHFFVQKQTLSDSETEPSQAMQTTSKNMMCGFTVPLCLLFSGPQLPGAQYANQAYTPAGHPIFMDLCCQGRMCVENIQDKLVSA